MADGAGFNVARLLSWAKSTMAKRGYWRPGLTVLWDSEKCIHCEACFSGLPAVFDPGRRPWVNIEGASIEAIVEQVRLCPSGALTVKEQDKNDPVDV